MPRIKHSPETPTSHYPQLVAELAVELTANREVGQPLIEEQLFPRTNTLRVTVIWDKWEDVPSEERVFTIHQAYEKAEGKDYGDRIALAIGVTYLEAYESGMLPYRVVAHLRPADPVTPEQCRQAFLEEGASLLFGDNHLQLRFATREQAEACRARLIKRFPGSEEIWGIDKDLSPVTP